MTRTGYIWIIVLMLLGMFESLHSFNQGKIVGQRGADRYYAEHWEPQKPHALHALDHGQLLCTLSENDAWSCETSPEDKLLEFPSVNIYDYEDHLPYTPTGAKP